MSPRAINVVTQAINEVNQKVLAETREDAFEEGFSEAYFEAYVEGYVEGFIEGFSEGRSKAMKKIALAFRDKVDLVELSEFTCLTVDEIKNL